MPLTDQSEMPYGKHKGELMEKVPASYLLWLWDDHLHSQHNAMGKVNDVRNYIRENFTTLETEATDTIVKHRP